MGDNFISYPTGITAHASCIENSCTMKSPRFYIGIFRLRLRLRSLSWARARSRGDRWIFRPSLIIHLLEGNIGFHHVHHLCPSIPNYNLEKVHRETPMCQQVTLVTLGSSLASISFKLYDEGQRRLVGFRHLRATGRRDS